jgi:transcriptional regulator with XRE-family HTH domain
MQKASLSGFAERMKHARELKELSQADVARKTGLQPSHISHFETAKRAPSFENLKALADALAISTDYLLGRELKTGALGPVVERVVRHAEKLTEGDLETLAAFAESLAGRRRRDDRRKVKEAS